MAKEEDKKKPPKYDWQDVLMLAIVMAALTGIFLGGLGTILGTIEANDFQATDVVAILSLPVGVISAVAAGIFGYSLGTRGTTEAQKLTSAATEETAAVSAESGASPRAIGRIVGRAMTGGASPTTDKYEISEDDLNTLLASAEPSARRLGIELPPQPKGPETPPPQEQPGQ